MTMTIAERMVRTLGARPRKGPSRRGFLGGAALVGAALAVDPWGYLVRPASAYESVCGTEPNCADGYSVFCCTINGGSNTCPPNSFIGGWWKADNSSFCGGSARYYIDCNAFRNGAWQCRCASGTCDSRRVACNQFRYGQCSLEVPASNTGPVVCRMVSCTPPWQQFGGTCTSSSATDNRTASHAAPCLDGQQPVGSLDVAGVEGSVIRLGGWTFDPDHTSTEIQVGIFVDGSFAGWYGTGRPRSDVNAAYGISGNHGFDISIPAGHGRHSINVHGIDVGPGEKGNPLIGSAVVTVGNLPIGCLDSLTPVPGGKVRVRGWAYDPDQPNTEIQVAVYRDGAGIAWMPTGQSRADVNSVFGITGRHGFDFMIDSPSGDHTIQVYGKNVGGGLENPLIGAGQVRVGLPMGNFDAVTANGRLVHVLGWAYDPDQPAAVTDVVLYWNGRRLGQFRAGGRRTDVDSVFGIGANHGFDIEVGCPPGPNTFEVFAINIGPAAGNPSLGSRTVQLK